MANGVEQDIRDIRKEVNVIQRDGCGHKIAHEESIGKLWGAIGSINSGRGEFMRNILLSVFGMVLLLLLGNFIVTKATISDAMKTNDVAAATIAAENRELLKQISKELKGK